MGTGYVRNDASNNIADANVIDAADLDGEFDAIVSAFSSSTGHTHDGTSAEGGAVTVVGPSQEFVGGIGDFSPKTDSTYNLGKTAVRWSTAYIDAVDVSGNVVVAGTVDGRDIGVDGTKLDSIETAADVTDTINVTSAGALMDSEVDVDIKTLVLPANTTISSFGRTLVDDADAAVALNTLGVSATAAELNKMDGVTATTSNLNQLDGNLFTSSIDVSGRLVASGGVDTVAAGGINHAFTGAPGSDGTILQIVAAGNPASNRDMVRFYRQGGSQVGAITFGSSSVSYLTTSDYRLKEEVETLTNSSDRLKLIRPVSYRFKAQEPNGPHTEGFIAHELSQIIPSAVSGEKDAVNDKGDIKPQQLDSIKVIPLLVSALQEALAEIESLKTRLDVLEAP